MSPRAAENIPEPAWTVYAKLCAVSIIWGGTFVAGRHLAGAGSPLVLAAIRFILAAVSLAAYLILSRTPLKRPDSRQCMQLAMLGFFGVFTYNLFFFKGLTLTTASRASLIVALNPAMIALVSYIVLREPLQRVRLVGVLLCILGASTVILSKSDTTLAGGSLSGDLLILGCVGSWVIYSVFSRNLSRDLGPLLTVCYSVWLGTAMLAILALIADGQVITAMLVELTGPQWFSLAFLGFIGSALAYIWYYDSILKIGATRSGAFIALNPLTAVLLGALLFGEELSLQICLGGALAIVGIYLCNRAPR